MWHVSSRSNEPCCDRLYLVTLFYLLVITSEGMQALKLLENLPVINWGVPANAHIFSTLLSISIASGALILQNIRLAHQSVRKSELCQNG